MLVAILDQQNHEIAKKIAAKKGQRTNILPKSKKKRIAKKRKMEVKGIEPLSEDL